MSNLILVVAADLYNAIGRGNALPWHLPDDLKRFKALTLGKPVLMGRKTAESIGRALPGRRNLVLTRGSTAPYAGQEVVSDFDAALAGVDGEVAVIGGGEIFAMALPHAGRVHLTRVHMRVEGADTWFPELDPAAWQESARVAHPADARHAHAFDFIDYVSR